MKNANPASKVGYHHGNLREALIASGLSMLATEGLADLSLRSLARQVGVSANAAYRHFTDKDDLLNAMAAEGFKRFALAQEQAVARQQDVAQRLCASGKAYIAFAMAHPALFRLMFDRVTKHLGHADLQASSAHAMAVLLECTADMTQAPVGDERSKVFAAAAWGLVHGLSDLAMGEQLAVLGMDPMVLVERVMAAPMSGGMSSGVGPPGIKSDLL